MDFARIRYALTPRTLFNPREGDQVEGLELPLRPSADENSFAAIRHPAFRVEHLADMLEAFLPEGFVLVGPAADESARAFAFGRFITDMNGIYFIGGSDYITRPFRSPKRGDIVIYSGSDHAARYAGDGRAQSRFERGSPVIEHP